MHHSRTSLRLTLVNSSLLVTILVGCDSTKPEAPQPLVIPQSTASAHEMIEVGVRGVVVPSQVSTGTFGGQAVSAARVNDTTLALVVPNLAAGQHELLLTVASKRFTGTFTVTAAPQIADAPAVIASVVDVAEVRLDSLVTALATPGQLPEGLDAADVQSDVDDLRKLADTASKLITKMTAAEKSQLAGILAANGIDLSAGGSLATVAFAGEKCVTSAGQTRYTYEECEGDLATFAQANALKVTKLAVLLGVGGAALGFGVATANPVLFAAGAVMVLYLKPDIILLGSHVLRRLTLPVIDQIGQPLFVAGAAVSATCTVGTPCAFSAVGTYRTPTQADVAAHPALSATLTPLNAIAETWNEIADKIDLSVKAPTFLTSGGQTVQADIPAEFLRVGATAPAPLSATAGVSGSTWNVTFAMTGIGDEHEVTLEIKHSMVSTAKSTRTVLLKPAVYAVKTVELPSDSVVLQKGGTTTLSAVVRDSGQRVLSGRTLAWTTSNAAAATVSSAGLVTAVDTGSAWIKVTASGTIQDVARDSLRVRVSKDTMDLSGVWNAVSENGQPLPHDNLKSITLTLSSDGTGTMQFVEQSPGEPVEVSDVDVVWTRTGQSVLIKEVGEFGEEWPGTIAGFTMTLHDDNGDTWVFEKSSTSASIQTVPKRVRSALTSR